MDLQHEDEQPSPKTLKSYNEVVHPISVANPEPTSGQPVDPNKNNNSDISALKDNANAESDQTLSTNIEQLNLDQSKLISDESAPLDSQLLQQSAEDQNSNFIGDMVTQPVNSNLQNFTRMSSSNGDVESTIRK